MSPKQDGKVDLLGGVALFRSCNGKELGRIASLMTETAAKAGEVLCREGDPGLQCFVVIDGKAAVTIGGKEIDTVGPGGFFGEMALLDGGPRVATITALDPMRLFVLSRGEFNALLDDVPGVARHMLAAIGGRLRAAETGERAAPVGV